jgi:hypothetical protein
MDYVELGVGAAIIFFGAAIWVYIKKAKSKLRRFILRGNG